ncbi:MAG TPA: folate family ECF transporter S component [Clostridia bacterium]|nr:folate family ECF transporter S component [Clostridia bacterium]
MSNAFIKRERKLSTETLVRVGLLTALSLVLKIVLEVYVPLAGIPSLRINFTSVPIMISGIICGPFAGFATGALSDLLGFAIKPAGPYFPGFTLSSALTGFIPGVIYKYLKRDMNFNVLNTLFILMISFGFAGILFTNGIMSFADGRFLYNGEKLGFAYPAILIVLIAAYIYVPIKTSTKVNGVKMDKIIFTVSVTQLICSMILNTYFLSILYGKGILAFMPGRVLSNYIMIPMYSMFISVLIKSMLAHNRRNTKKNKTEVGHVIQK